MAEDNVDMECQEYEMVPEEEVVETSYMCGQCFLLFPTTEEFNAHQCQESHMDRVESVIVTAEQDGVKTKLLNDAGGNPCVWEARESEAAMEEAVASILGEKLKKMGPPRKSPDSRVVEFEPSLDMVDDPDEPSIEHTGIMDHHVESVVEHTVENKDPGQMERVEIPSTNCYIYDNPVYLNRLMKDNTFGRRVRHDAPYRLRLGPWDNKCSRLLIQLLKEFPKAYFILDKECKRTEAWEMIRNKMGDEGYQFTVLQIRMRWRELVKTYRTTINYNDLHNARRSCQFFEELNDLFGIWDYSATIILIRQMELHGSKRLGQNGGTRMRFKIWNNIRIVLEEQGYTFTADQVQGRWSTLVNLYQRMVENNSKPHNEKMTMAYKEIMEQVFNYHPERNAKWLKIMEKRGKMPKSVKKNWTYAIDRELLMLYRNRIYRFNNEHVNNNALWEEIVQYLKENADYSTNADKVRSRFSELIKQFAMVWKHNSQTGTIRREFKHHELLSEIYSVYNYWPHDKSSIKLNKSNAVRMRQVNAQLAWTEEQSRSVLQLYPQVLVSHCSGGDHQPLEEFWLQLAKAYLNAQNDRKQCYEIEEHIALLRRGYHSRNPFPFSSEMQFLEETEVTLGFSPEPVVTDSDQLVPYWSHTAAILLLELVMECRQEGIKHIGLFEMISRELGYHGYRYTGEECRVYYSLLRQLYSNRVKTLKRNRELLKPFPYMDKMAEVDGVVSLPRFVDTDSNRKIILMNASMIIERMAEEEPLDVFSLLSKIRLHLRQKNLLHPLPSLSKVGQILRDAINDSSINSKEVLYLRIILEPYGEDLSVIADRIQPIPHCKNRRVVLKKELAKFSVVEWTTSNITAMLEVIKDWRLMCHDTAEFECMVGTDQFLWEDVATRLKCTTNTSFNKCQERFLQLYREYKSVVTFNARIGSDEPSKSVRCQNLLEALIAPLMFHEGNMDPRDEVCSEEFRDWGQYQTIQLLFTVRELGTCVSKVNWESVYLFMRASGYDINQESCRSRFLELKKSFELALEYNQSCSIKCRKRPPFYYKMKTLFGGNDTFEQEQDPAKDQKIAVDEEIVLRVLVELLKQVKGHYCHSVPRRSLLFVLARLLDSHFGCSSPTFSGHQVWQYMVKLHELNQDASERNSVADLPENLGDTWHNHPCPLVAYNLLAVPLPHWQLTRNWSAEEVYLLLEGTISWELQPRTVQDHKMTLSQSASEMLHTHGCKKTPKQCFNQWQYLTSTYHNGGYRHFSEQLSVLHLINPTALQIKPSTMRIKVKTVKCSKSEIKNGNSKKYDLIQAPVLDVPSGSHHSKKAPPKGSNKRGKMHTKSSLLIDKKPLSAPGEVVSYVRINVPQRTRSIQVSTDELHESDNIVSCTSEVEEANDDVLSPNTKTCIINVECISNDAVDNQGASESSKSNVTYCHPLKRKAEIQRQFIEANSGKQKDVLKHPVIKVTKHKDSKFLKCQTEGSKSRTDKTLLLTDIAKKSFPRSQAMLASLDGRKTKQTPVTQHDFSCNKYDIHPTENKKELALFNGNDERKTSVVILKEELEENDSSTICAESNSENEKNSSVHEIFNLLDEYRKHCNQEKADIMKMVQEIHMCQTVAHENIFKIVQDMHENLT